MAGTYTVKTRTVFGDLKVVIYTCTNFTDGETVTVSNMRQIFHAVAQQQTQDKSVGVAIGSGASANVLTFDTSADTFDGTLIVYGK